MNIFLLSMLFCVAVVPGLGEVRGGWFDPPASPPTPPRKEYPFDRAHVEPLCTYMFADGEPNTRYISNSFLVKYHSGFYALECTGHDPILGLNVKLHFDDMERQKLAVCSVYNKEEAYIADNIFKFTISPNKRMFMISFNECDTILVIYISRAHDAIGFWTLPTE